MPPSSRRVTFYQRLLESCLTCVSDCQRTPAPIYHPRRVCVHPCYTSSERPASRVRRNERLPHRSRAVHLSRLDIHCRTRTPQSNLVRVYLVHGSLRPRRPEQSSDCARNPLRRRPLVLGKPDDVRHDAALRPAQRGTRYAAQTPLVTRGGLDDLHPRIGGHWHIRIFTRHRKRLVD
jgi:hypothetical protein